MRTPTTRTATRRPDVRTTGCARGLARARSCCRRGSGAGPAGWTARPCGRRLSHRTHVSSTIPSATRPAVMRMAEPARCRPCPHVGRHLQRGHPAGGADHEGGRRDGVGQEEQREGIGRAPVGEARPAAQLGRRRRRRRGTGGEGQRGRVEPEVEHVHDADVDPVGICGVRRTHSSGSGATKGGVPS